MKEGTSLGKHAVGERFCVWLAVLACGAHDFSIAGGEGGRRGERRCVEVVGHINLVQYGRQFAQHKQSNQKQSICT